MVAKRTNMVVAYPFTLPDKRLAAFATDVPLADRSLFFGNCIVMPCHIFNAAGLGLTKVKIGIFLGLNHSIYLFNTGILTISLFESKFCAG